MFLCLIFVFAALDVIALARNVLLHGVIKAETVAVADLVGRRDHPVGGRAGLILRAVADFGSRLAKAGRATAPAD